MQRPPVQWPFPLMRNLFPWLEVSYCDSPTHSYVGLRFGSYELQHITKRDEVRVGPNKVPQPLPTTPGKIGLCPNSTATCTTALQCTIMSLDTRFVRNTWGYVNGPSFGAWRSTEAQKG